MKKFLATTAAAAAMSLAFVTPVDATMFQKVEQYSGEVNFPIDGFCGIEELQFNAEFSGRTLIREGKGKQEGAFFLHDNFSVLETVTNRQNGKFLTVSRNGVFQDVRATRADGSIFEFVSHEAGQPFVVRDMDGNVVLRDRGAITFTYLFDTLGDDVPGGVEIGEPDIRISGPHPGFGPPDCEGVQNLIG